MVLLLLVEWRTAEIQVTGWHSVAIGNHGTSANETDMNTCRKKKQKDESQSEANGAKGGKGI